MNTMTYLAKDGKVSGPFDHDKIEELKKSGTFYEYEWMWDGQAPDWSPVPRKLKSPPTMLPDGTNPAIQQPTAAQLQSPQVKTKSNIEIETSKKNFYAVCFDNRTTMGGEVNHAHSRGGKFTSVSGSGSPFPKGATVWLDLLDEKTDKSAKIKSVITSVNREKDQWVLDLEWTSCPLL